MSIQVPSDLADAIEAKERTILLRVAVDWDADGFGPAGSIDDLSNRIGTLKVTRALTTDLPDPVRIVEGVSAATGTVDLTEGDPTDETMHAARYYTRGSDSPLGSKERNNRPLTVDIGCRTASGPRYVRRLTGVTRRMKTTSRGRTAVMDLLDNRARLRNTVNLIPTDGTTAGADGTWIVWQALYANGIPAGPLPRSSGLQMWAPMYGSLNTIRPDRNPNWITGFITPTHPFGSEARAQFRPGPFVLATAPFYNSATDYAQASLQSLTPITPGWTARQFRLEMWCLGVPSTTNASGNRTVVGITSVLTQPPVGTIYLGVDSNGHPQMKTYDHTNTVIHTFTGSAVVPNDGAWHFVGVHFDRDAQTVTFRVDASLQTLSTSAIGVADELPPVVDSMGMGSIAPVSDVFVHDVPAATPWLIDLPIPIAAVLDRSALTLVASYDDTPFEGWDLVTSVAKAEQAVALFDEDGIFRYRTRGRLVTPAGQTVQRVLTTQDASLLDIGIDDGLDRIRNIIQVTYSPVTVNALFDFVYEDTIPRVLPPGTITFQVSFADPVISLQSGAVPQDFAAWKATTHFDPYIIFTVNSDFTDDLGTADVYFSQVTCTSDVWSTRSATVVVKNTSGTTLYITHLGLKGLGVKVGNPVIAEARNATSIAANGAQPLQITLPEWVQSTGVAQSLAAQLLGDLKDPHPQVTGVTVIGDPRRQLGDRVRFADPDGTHLDGEFWLTEVTDDVDGNGGYTQTVSARAATTVARYGIGRYGVETYG